VNPRRQAEANDLVVGYTHKGDELTFKRLIQDGAQRYLRPLNPQFPMVSIDGNFQVVGVVTGMRMIIEKGVIR
jgi:SOS-response transcriptional repressor LexA